MCFDHYFASGKNFNKLIKKNKFSFKNIYTSGLMRADLLKNKKKNISINKVLVFDVPNIGFYESKMWGDFSSIKKRIYLYNGILRIASKNPDIKFIIKPKFSENFNDNLIPSVERKIKKNNLKNIIFIHNLNRINTYNLVNECDVVIGSYSSIFDELFSRGNKILIYDKNFINFNHPLKNTAIHCKNFSHLINQFNNLINNKNNDDKNLVNIRNNFFYYGKNTNYDFIINKINTILK